MTREEIVKAFDVDDNGVIKSPGKFEAEMLYVPHFWDMIAMGDGEDLMFSDGHFVTIIEITEGDRIEFPELEGVMQIALEESEQGFVNTTTDSTEIENLRKSFETQEETNETESEVPDPDKEEGLMAQESAGGAEMPEDFGVGTPEDFAIGDKVEFVVHLGTEDVVSQGEIASIEDGIATVKIMGDSKMPEWVALNELTKIDQYSPVTDTPSVMEELPKVQKDMATNEMAVAEASIIDPITASEDARKMVIQAMGYKDTAGQLRACFLLGLAEQKLWKSAVDQVKKKHEKEMKEKVKALTKWGTVQPSEAAVKDVIAKVLIANGISAYPNLVAGIYANPFQSGHGFDKPHNETMSEPR